MVLLITQFSSLNLQQMTSVSETNLAQHPNNIVKTITSSDKIV